MNGKIFEEKKRDFLGRREEEKKKNTTLQTKIVNIKKKLYI